MSGKDNFLLDTNVVLNFLKGKDKVCSFLRSYLTSQAPNFSQITRMELLGFVNLTEEEEQAIRSLFSFGKILPISEEVCDQAIVLKRKIKLKLPDAIIAATAVCFNLILITEDKELSKKIESFVNINPIVSS